MKIRFPFSGNTLGAVLGNTAVGIGILLFVGITFFYVYLPSTTNHGEQIEVPELVGLNISRIDSVLTPLHLRFEVGDSAYSADHPPLTVLQQYPKAHHRVKENRKIYVSINRTSPPTLPMPNLFGDGAGSLINAEAVLRSSELKRGRIIRQRNPNRDLLIEMRLGGKVIRPGMRIPKGSVIDLVVGDGAGPRDFVINNFVGLDYKNVLLRLTNLSLNLGSVQIPEGIDTTGVTNYVLKQYPAAGDSVSIGDPVNLWIGPKGTEITDDEQDEEGQP